MHPHEHFKGRDITQPDGVVDVPPDFGLTEGRTMTPTQWRNRAEIKRITFNPWPLVGLAACLASAVLVLGALVAMVT